MIQKFKQDFNVQPGLSNAPEEERASILAKIEIS